LAELAFSTLKHEYHNFELKDIRIILIEAAGRILYSMPESLSNETEKSLLRLGVIIKKNSFVTSITDREITIKFDDGAEKISTRNVMWTAGVKGSSISKVLVKKTGVQLDQVGRVLVKADLTIPGFENIFVIGDLANYSHQTGQPLPGIAPVAIQEGKFVAMSIIARQLNKKKPNFIYRNKGILAVIGRNAALADFGWIKFSGFFAWLLWAFVHILYLIEFDNRFVVIFRWAWNYFTNNKGSRLITGKYAYNIRE
jgi:NADH dehydrogenase